MTDCISLGRTDHDRLCMGRSPLATARLKGASEGSALWGRVDCYGTPAGLRISVTVNGLPHGSKTGFSIYRLCLEREDGYFLCAVIPPLYERNGSAWCSVITRKLELSDLMGGRLSIRRWNEARGRREGVSVAEGLLIYP